jgi:hypothetical protein
MVFENLKTKELIFLTLMGVLWFLLDFIVGQWVNAVTGLFLIGAAVSSIVAGFFAIILIKIRPKFGTLTIPLLIFGILCIPTPSGGPVGFWPTAVINFLVGLIADAWLKATKYKNWAIITSFYILATLLLYSQTIVMVWMGIPESQKILSLMHFVVLGFWIIGSLGLWLGFKVYKKIKDKPIIRQISA